MATASIAHVLRKDKHIHGLAPIQAHALHGHVLQHALNFIRQCAIAPANHKLLMNLGEPLLASPHFDIDQGRNLTYEHMQHPCRKEALLSKRGICTINLFNASALHGSPVCSSWFGRLTCSTKMCPDGLIERVHQIGADNLGKSDGIFDAQTVSHVDKADF